MTGKRVGLVIGNNYPNSDKELRFAVADALSMKEVLLNKDICGFDEVEESIDDTFVDARIKIEKVLKNANNKDLVFIYFSGHGKKHLDNGLHLLFKDFREDFPLATSLNFDYINRCMKYPSLKSVIIVLDCCYSGVAGIKGDDLEETFSNYSSGLGTVILTSTGLIGSSKAKEDIELKHGVFTSYLLEGLENGIADDDEDDFIYLNDLYKYARKKTITRCSQSPLMKTQTEREILIAKNPNKIKEIEYESKKKQLFEKYIVYKLPNSILNESQTILRKYYYAESILEPIDKTIYSLLNSFLEGVLSHENYIESIQQIKRISISSVDRYKKEKAEFQANLKKDTKYKTYSEMSHQIQANYYNIYYKNKPKNADEFESVVVYLKPFNKDDFYAFLNPGTLQNTDKLPCDKLKQPAQEKKKKDFYKNDTYSIAGKKVCEACELAFRDESSKTTYDGYLAWRKRKNILDHAKKISKIADGNLSYEQGDVYIGQLTELFKDRKLAENIFIAFCKIEKIAYKRKIAKYVYGIDLGTTYSCIAYVDESGRANVIKNLEGTNTTPSVVNFASPNQVVVGHVAKEIAVIDPKNTVSLVKTLMGKSNFAINYNGEDKSPEEVSAYILRKLAEDAAKEIDAEVKDVVITCPAYFGTAERTATKNAGIISGLNVLEIISEPVAAAIYYGCTRQHEEKTILVYDLGGGTFDVTIMSINSEKIEIICSEGDHDLGGKDWDAATMRYLANEFVSQTGYNDDFDIYARQDLLLKAEKAKQQLSAKEKTLVMVDVYGERARIEFSRETFDEITSALLKSTLDKTDAVITVAGQRGFKVDEILLVGGSTRMPQVTRALEERYSIKPKILDPDEAVAKGAVIHAVNVYINNQPTLSKWDEDDKGNAFGFRYRSI